MISKRAFSGIIMVTKVLPNHFTLGKKSLVIKKSTRSEAMELEKKVKNLSKIRLKNFIEKYKE